MREKFSRTLAGLIVVAAVWTAYLQISNFSELRSWGNWVTLVGMVLLVVAFAVYAAAGKRSADRVLSLLSAPERITNKVLRRVIAEEDHEVAGLTASKDEKTPSSVMLPKHESPQSPK